MENINTLPECCQPFNGDCSECHCYDFCTMDRFYENCPERGLPYEEMKRLFRLALLEEKNKATSPGG